MDLDDVKAYPPENAGQRTPPCVVVHPLLARRTPGLYGIAPPRLKNLIALIALIALITLITLIALTQAPSWQLDRSFATPWERGNKKLDFSAALCYHFSTLMSRVLM